MKQIIIVNCLFAVMAFSAHATQLSPGKTVIEPSSINRLIRLVDKDQTGSAQKKVQVVVVDNGMSTDVSPRYSVYLGFASAAETGNLRANYLITDQAFKFISANRKGAGIYYIQYVEYREGGLVEVTLEVDAVNMFVAEKQMRKTCIDDFCDGKIEAAISVKEVNKKQTR